MIKTLLIFLSVVHLGLLGCSKSQVTDDSSEGAITSVKVNMDEKSCVTPWGETLHSGEVRKGYRQRNLGSCSDSCEAQSGILSCQDGQLKGAEHFIYDRCDRPHCGCTLDFLPERPSLKHGDWITLYKETSVQCASCNSIKEERQCVDGVLSGSANAVSKSCQEIPCRDCVVSSSETITHGQTKNFYQVSTGQACRPAEACAGKRLVRTCRNGSFDGDPVFSQTSCTDVPCNCSIGTREYAHGSSVEYFSSPQASCSSGQTCAGMRSTSTCTNGVIAGLPAVAYPACAQQTCNCEFTDLNGTRITVPNGGTMNVFASNSVTCGQTCTGGQVQCAAGVLTGDVHLKGSSCSSQACTCSTPWGSLFAAHENAATAPVVGFYKQGQSMCGQNKCVSIADNLRQYKCLKNGGNVYWADADGNTVTDFSVYRFSSCVDPTCNCSVSGRTVQEGKSLTFYRQSQVACGQPCEGGGKSITVRCKSDLTTEVVPAGGDLAAFLSSGEVHNSCQMAACPSGQAGAGTPAISGSGDGDAGDGGGTGGGLGDGEGPGFHFSGRSSGAGGPGSSQEARAFIYSLGPYGEGCELPWGGHVTHFGSVTAFTRANAPAGQKCSSYRVTRMCISGKLEGNPAAVHLNCLETP